MCCHKSHLVFSCCFEDNDISQRSVATNLRCGEIFIFFYQLSPDSDSEKKFENRSIFDEVVTRTTCVNILGPPCISPIIRVTLWQPWLGQQTNSAPLKPSMAHGWRTEKRWSLAPWRAVHASDVVLFQASYVLQLLDSWMWSNWQCSGTRNASLWNAPTARTHTHPTTHTHTRTVSVQEYVSAFFSYLKPATFKWLSKTSSAQV